MEAGAQPSELVDVTTQAALEEKSKLRRHFGRFDILFFLICTIVGLDTLGAVASNGAEGFTWLIFLSVFFFIPYALLTAELGAAFPEEGGCYEWTKLAFGRFVLGRQLGDLLALEPDLARRRARDHRADDVLDLLHRHLRHAATRGATCSCSASSGSRCGARSSRSTSASGSRRSARSRG